MSGALHRDVSVAGLGIISSSPVQQCHAWVVSLVMSRTSQERQSTNRCWVLSSATSLGGLLAGLALGNTIRPFDVDVAIWRSLGRDFLTSAGFGGLMAVVAALIALSAALTSSRRARDQAMADRAQRSRADAKTQWWSRTECALNATASENPDVSVIGQKVLESLSESALADEEDAAIIAAATIDFLEDATEVEVTEAEAPSPSTDPSR